MWRGGEFFCGAGQPNVVTRIKCGDPCINFGVAISSRGDAPPPPNTPPPPSGVATSAFGKWPDGILHCVQGSGPAFGGVGLAISNVHCCEKIQIVINDNSFNGIDGLMKRSKTLYKRR